MFSQKCDVILDSNCYIFESFKRKSVSSFECLITKNNEDFDSLQIQQYTTLSSNVSASVIIEYKVTSRQFEFPLDLVYLYYSSKNVLLEVTELEEKRYLKEVDDENLLLSISKLALSFNYYNQNYNENYIDFLRKQGLLNIIESKLDLLIIIK